MAEDASPIGEYGQLRLDERRQLAHDVAAHPVCARPRSDGRVDVEARPEPEVPVLVVALDAHRTWARIERDQREAYVGGDALCTRFGHEGLLAAGEPCEEVERRHPLTVDRRPRWQEHREAHRPGAGLARVLVEALHTAEGVVLAA
jgi:hypothetical protein